MSATIPDTLRAHDRRLFAVGAFALLLLATLAGSLAAWRDAVTRTSVAVLEDRRIRAESLSVHYTLAQRDARLRADASRQAMAVAVAEARHDAAAARAAIANARRKSAGVHIAPRDTVLEGDTVTYAKVGRAGDARTYPVPKFFTGAYLAQFAALDSAVVALASSERALVAAERTIARYVEASALGDSLVVGLRHEIALQDSIIRAVRPGRCGRRCGVAIGAVGTAAAVTLAALLGGVGR